MRQRASWVYGGDFEFPSADRADRDGVVAIGGDVTPTVLRRAYRSGIFPWPVRIDLPMFWFSPDPRFLVDLEAVHIPRSLAKLVRQQRFEIRYDTAFSDVMAACATARRDGGGTWIDPRVVGGFVALHAEGRRDRVSAHSVEAWRDGKLVGGLYGTAAGACFAGESMFFREPDASKVAFAVLAERLQSNGFHFIDCQVYTENLARFGAVETPRTSFLRKLAAALEHDIPF